MEEALAASRAREEGRRSSLCVTGRRLTSAPMSTTKRRLEWTSRTKRRRLLGPQEVDAPRVETTSVLSDDEAEQPHLAAAELTLL